MLFRAVLIIGVISPALFAAELAVSTLLANQNTGTLRDLNRQALDRQIRSSLLGKERADKNQFLPLHGRNPLLLGGTVKIASPSECSIPLTQMRIDGTKRFTVRSSKLPKADFDAMAKAPPFPACKN